MNLMGFKLTWILSINVVSVLGRISSATVPISWFMYMCYCE